MDTKERIYRSVMGCLSQYRSTALALLSKSRRYWNSDEGPRDLEAIITNAFWSKLIGDGIQVMSPLTCICMKKSLDVAISTGEDTFIHQSVTSPNPYSKA